MFSALTRGGHSPHRSEKAVNGATLPVYNGLASLVLAPKCVLWIPTAPALLLPGKSAKRNSNTTRTSAQYNVLNRVNIKACQLMLQVATWGKDYLGKLAYQKPSRRAI